MKYVQNIILSFSWKLFTGCSRSGTFPFLLKEVSIKYKMFGVVLSYMRENQGFAY